MKYLFPCSECGTNHKIDIAQAGQRITCACGAALEVPTMRGIRQLEVAEPTGGETADKPAWSPRLGAAFVGGVALMVLGLIVVGMGVIGWSRLVVPDPVAYDPRHTDEMLESLSPMATFELWEDVKKAGLGPYQKPAYLMANEAKTKLTWILVSGGIVTAVGLIVVVGATMAGRRTRQ